MKHFYGVNLGGWFVLESWMKPALFEGIDSKDETGFCLKNPNAKEDLIKHWSSYLTADDFKEIKSLGITHVRLPIPWWLEGEAPYFGSLSYIHQAMQWATDHDLHVLLDLHTAPGCQNGFDNGGIDGQIGWHLDPKNIDLTIEKLGFIARTFKNYPSYWGLEVLNEPHPSIPLDIIEDFYLRSYEIIRRETDKVIVFHDAFRPQDPKWETFFKKNSLENVMFDMHLYHCFDPKLVKGTMQDHINEILGKRLPMIEKVSAFVDVIIGEWSLGVNYHEMKKPSDYNEKLYDRIFADLQLYIYQHAAGDFFWNYKQENNRTGWNYKKLIQLGILPKPIDLK